MKFKLRTDLHQEIQNGSGEAQFGNVTAVTNAVCSPGSVSDCSEKGGGGKGVSPPELTAAFWSLHELNQQPEHTTFGHSLTEQEKN